MTVHFRPFQGLRAGWIALSIALCSLLSTQGFAQPQLPPNDTGNLSQRADVEVLAQPARLLAYQQPTVEVALFFWYGCPHCAQFEPSFSAWQARQDAQVNTVLVPVSWHPAMSVHQRMYFTLHALKRLDLHPQLFQAVANSAEHIRSAQHAQTWAKSQGIAEKKWRNAYSSASVNKQVQWAQSAFEHFELSGVPAIIVDGQYKLVQHTDVLRTLDEVVQHQKALLPVISQP